MFVAVTRLSDPRITIVLNDGRNGLALTNKKYDYIVSQPSHPWTAGASHLYTHEFNQIARKHLRPGGVFLQWMDLQFVDIDLMRSMTAGLLKTFPYVRLYEPARGSLMFVSSDQPIEPEKVNRSDFGMCPCGSKFLSRVRDGQANGSVGLVKDGHRRAARFCWRCSGDHGRI